MIFTLLGAACGALLGVYSALSETSGRYFFVTTVAVTVGFFGGRGVDIVIDRWRSRWPR
jgi:hypothetical protein